MGYESNCGLEVLQNLFVRQELLQQNDARKETIRPVLFGGGGVFRGVDGAARACALEHHNLHPVFTHVCGTSTGAASGQFFLSGHTRDNINIYWKEAATEQFISFRRLFLGKAIEGTQFLSDVFKAKLDLNAFLDATPEFHVAVTHAVTGVGSFINAKTSRNALHEAVRASFSIPFLCGEPVMIGGEPYYDGVGAMAMPTKEIIEQFHPTDLLIFANAPKEELESSIKRAIEVLCFRNLPPGARDAFLTRGPRFNQGIEYLKQRQDIRWMIVWSEEVGLFERREEVLQDAARRAEDSFSALLQEAKASLKEQRMPRVA
ncbi:MAG: patatin-like phospholipase family protein [Patescibacteria group bacterium]